MTVSAPARARLAAALPYAVFAALCLLTWKRWIFPFQDHGREMNVPARLAAGETLYRDVASPFGPLPPHVDAAALRLFGRSLDVLLAVRVLAALAALEALRRLLRRLAPDPLAAGAIAAFVVAACGFSYGSAWVFPYSVAALWGTAGTWWGVELALGASSMRGALFAAAVAGLAAGTKLEIAPAALGGLVLALAGRRPRRELFAGSAVAVALAALAWGVPPLLLGRGVLERQGFLIALHDPEPWRRMQRLVFFGGMSPAAFFEGGYARALAPSLLFLAAAALLLRFVRGRSAAPLAFAAGAASALVPRSEELHALLPLAAIVALAALWRRPRARAAGSIAAAAVAAPMLLALWRQPFLLKIPLYAAFAAPLALAFALAWASARLPHVAALVLGLTLAQGIDRARDRAAIPMTWVSLPHVAIWLPSECAGVVAGAVHAIRATPPGSFVAAFPEPGLLLFSGERFNPFADEQFFPGHQDARAEEDMIARLGTRPPVLAFQTNQRFSGFGTGDYRHGVLDRFFLAFDARYAPAGVLGDPRVPIRRLGTATAAVVYVPRRTP